MALVLQHGEAVVGVHQPQQLPLHAHLEELVLQQLLPSADQHDKKVVVVAVVVVVAHHGEHGAAHPGGHGAVHGGAGHHEDHRAGAQAAAEPDRMQHVVHSNVQRPVSTNSSLQPEAPQRRPAVEAGGLQDLKTAVEATGLQDTLASSGPFTVFTVAMEVVVVVVVAQVPVVVLEVGGVPPPPPGRHTVSATPRQQTTSVQGEQSTIGLRSHSYKPTQATPNPARSIPQPRASPRPTGSKWADSQNIDRRENEWQARYRLPAHCAVLRKPHLADVRILVSHSVLARCTSPVVHLDTTLASPEPHHSAVSGRCRTTRPSTAGPVAA